MHGSIDVLILPFYNSRELLPRDSFRVIGCRVLTDQAHGMR
jgi:hypothetical protein